MITHAWRIWPSLLLAPAMALGELSIVYAMVTPLCSVQGGEWMHAVSLAFVVAGALLTALAWAEARRLKQAHGAPVPTDTDRHGPQQLFLARVATWSGALSLLVMVALWIPPWVLSPCT
jgi:hypothetical protein